MKEEKQDQRRITNQRKAATLYTLAQSARWNCVDVWPYLTDVLRRLPAIPPVNTAALEALEESPDELGSRQGLGFPLPFSAILITERHLTAIDADQSTVGKGHAADIRPKYCKTLSVPRTVGSR